LIVYYLLAPRSSLERSGVKNSTKSNSSIRNYFLSWSRFASAKSKSENNLYIRYFILFNIFVFLSLLTFYGSIFFIAAVYLFLLFKKQFRLLLMVLLGFVMAGILIYPLFIQQYINSKIALSAVANWDLVLGQANLKNLLLIPIKFSIGRISFEPKTIYWIISGAWTTYLFSLILRPKSNLVGYFSGGGLLWLFFVPLFLGFIVSFFIPVLRYFRFIFLLPLFVLLIALGTYKKQKNQPARLVFWQRVVVLGGFIVFSLIYLLNPFYHREDWKSLVKNLNLNAIYMIPSSSDPVKYYDKNVEIRDLKAIDRLDLENEITVIPYTAEIHGVTYAETLEKLGYGLRSEKSYREVKVETWILTNN